LFFSYYFEVLNVLYSILLSTLIFYSNETEDHVTVNVHITNVENSDSHLMVAVFSHYSNFLTERMYRTERIEVTDFTETYVKFNVQPGEYAIAVFQDINKNGDLDKNIFSYPTEPFGFSNNYRPTIKPPHWTDVAFQADEDRTIEVELK